MMMQASDPGPQSIIPSAISRHVNNPIYAEEAQQIVTHAEMFYVKRFGAIQRGTRRVHIPYPNRAVPAGPFAP
jgi:hypothetical protein